MLVTNGVMVARVTMQELNYETFTLSEDISPMYFHDDPKMKIAREWAVAAIVEDLDECGEAIQHWKCTTNLRRVTWEWLGALTWLQVHPELL